MSENREPLNPYDPPQTVASGENEQGVKQEGPKAEDLRYQLIGFISLWLIALACVALSGLSYYLSERIPDKPGWDSLHNFLLGLSFVSGLLAAIGLVACSPWVLISLTHWLIERGSGHYVRSKDAD